LVSLFLFISNLDCVYGKGGGVIIVSSVDLGHIIIIIIIINSLPSIVRVVKSKRMRWAGHVARVGEERGVHRVLVGKPEGKRPLGRPRLRWEDKIKMYVQEVGGVRGDWMELAQDRDGWWELVSTV
jgi:hypothetical protein